jgi:2-dehydrotetronate isomerase
VEKGIETIHAVDADNLKLMFDCYHTQIMQGDIIHRLKESLPFIGHVQIAAVPDRGEPDRGEINYPWLLSELAAMGRQSFIGAEYRPRAGTDEGLSWMRAYSREQ